MRGRFAKYMTGAVSVFALLLVSQTAAHAQLAREMPPVPLPGEPVAARGPLLPTESPFALDQLRYDRVLEARMATRFTIKRLFHERGIRYPAAEIFLRIFKRERSLELWVRPDGQERFALLKTYPICALAGGLGPKRRQGDSQVPEGFYNIDFFNPVSEYHLSLHVDYPNRHDRALGDGNLGGDIYIHGGCASEGCLALTDEGIRELYWIAVEARAVGQTRIPVHIFPARLENRDMELLQSAFKARPDLVRFWDSLKPAYDFFQTSQRVPAVIVDGQGSYRLNGVAEPSTAKPAVPEVNRKVPLGSPVGGGGETSAAAAPAGSGAPVPMGTEVAPTTGAAVPTTPTTRPVGGGGGEIPIRIVPLPWRGD
jgi:murein L,D-transpeptidase YafK